MDEQSDWGVMRSLGGGREEEQEQEQNNLEV